MLLSRRAFLNLADINVGAFKNLDARDQLPFPKGFDDDRGYSARLAILLKMSELVANNSSMSRDEIKSCFIRRLGKITRRFDETAGDDDVWVAIYSYATGDYEIEVGAYDFVSDALRAAPGSESERIVSVTFINAAATFRGLKDRLAKLTEALKG